MSLFSKLFGGTDSKALDAQAETNTATGKKLAELAERARADIASLFPKATEARSQGLEGAFRVLANVIPEQMRVFQEGNRAAQETQALGLTGMNRALLGLPLDLRASQTMQAVKVPEFNLSPEMVMKLLPQFQDPTTGLQRTAQPNNFNIAQFLSGTGMGGMI